MSLLRLLLPIATLVVVLGGCDPTVQSFEDNGRDYSIFGYLDASADTQYVRVEPLRDSMLTRAPETLGADVTLTHLETGRIVALRDSLFRFLDGATFHNFYTTVDIEPTATYRLEVRGPGGAESRAQTVVPDTFPSPEILAAVEEARCVPEGSDEENNPAVLRLRGIERLVAVKTLYYRTNPRTRWAVDHLADTLQTAPGTILAEIPYGTDICDVPRGRDGQVDVFRIEVVVAAGDPEWPDFTGLDPALKTLPEATSNVEGGVGYLGGVVTDTALIFPTGAEGRGAVP